MDFPKKKPSLPRLATNIESQSSPSLPLLHRKSEENARPKPERPWTLQSPYPEERGDTILPALHYVPHKSVPLPWEEILPLKECQNLPAPKKKTQYYEDAFNARGVHNSPQDRVAQDSIVVIELKTNCKIKDEQSKLVGDLIFRLAQIYQRPETSIMLTLQQEAGVFFGNTTELSYLLKVYALPPLIAPFTNLRNTSLIQSAMQDLLHIPMERGVIIYTSVPEDNLANNGSTARGEIVRLERNEQEDSPGIFKTISRSMSRRLKNNSSSGGSAHVSIPSTAGTAGASAAVSSTQTEIHHSPTILENPTETLVEKSNSIRKRMSFRTIRKRLSEVTSAREKAEKE
ncbi:Tautomerase [Penicillium herquei]|nr:Tautomerase [Penicillium herquei]